MQRMQRMQRARTRRLLSTKINQKYEKNSTFWWIQKSQNWTENVYFWTSYKTIWSFVWLDCQKKLKQKRQVEYRKKINFQVKRRKKNIHFFFFLLCLIWNAHCMQMRVSLGTRIQLEWDSGPMVRGMRAGHVNGRCVAERAPSKGLGVILLLFFLFLFFFHRPCFKLSGPLYFHYLLIFHLAEVSILP